MKVPLGHTWLALLVAATLVWPAAAPQAAVAATSADLAALARTPIRSVYVREPQGGVTPGKPLQVLLALHGMGGNGVDFSRDLIEQADHYGWLLVAPTIDYGDWTNPNVIAAEDPLLIRALAAYIEQLPRITGTQTRRMVLVLGHSRGAQLAHRFAEFRPDLVLAVAALSAGTYTLPLAAGPEGSFAFPYGVKDFAQYSGGGFDARRFAAVQFWVGVGGQDIDPADVPRQWDRYEGVTRVQRAEAFEAAMLQIGARSSLREFANARHDVTAEMRSAACAFLGGAIAPRVLLPSPVAEAPARY